VVRDELDPLSEPVGDRVGEIAPAAAKGKDPQLVVLECPALHELQKPAFRTPLVEPVQHVENSHAIYFTPAHVRDRPGTRRSRTSMAETDPCSAGIPRAPHGVPGPLDDLIDRPNDEDRPEQKQQIGP
jgi:hypothetical protein